MTSASCSAHHSSSSSSRKCRVLCSMRHCRSMAEILSHGASGMDTPQYLRIGMCYNYLHTTGQERPSGCARNHLCQPCRRPRRQSSLIAPPSPSAARQLLHYVKPPSPIRTPRSHSADEKPQMSRMISWLRGVRSRFSRNSH
jgi:hypothetical protein